MRTRRSKLSRVVSAKARVPRSASNGVAQEKKSKTLVKITVTAAAKRDSVAVGKGGRLLVEVRAEAKENEANHSVRKLVAEYFKVRSPAVRIISGHQRPSKILEITR